MAHLPVKSLPALLRGITSNHYEDFTIWVIYIHFVQIISFKNITNYVIIMITVMQKCLVNKKKNIKMQSRKKKSLKSQFRIYFDLESLLKKEKSCQNNPEKNCTLRKQLSLNLQARQCLQNVHLMKPKINVIIKDELVVFKSGVKK